MDATFLEQLAQFNGQLLAQALLAAIKREAQV
jgi:hypothetical protein